MQLKKEKFDKKCYKPPQYSMILVVKDTKNRKKCLYAKFSIDPSEIDIVFPLIKMFRKELINQLCSISLMNLLVFNQHLCHSSLNLGAST